MAYAVVLFSGEEDDVAVVSTSWLINEKDCYWPPYRTSARIDKAVRASENPGANWSIHAIRVLSTTDSYDTARSQLRQAEYTSDLQTDVENPPAKRHRRVNRRYASDSDDEMELESQPRSPTPPPQRASPVIVNLDGPRTSTPVVHRPRSSQRPSNQPRTQSPPPQRRRPTPPAITPLRQELNNSTVDNTQRLILTLLTEIKSELVELKKTVESQKHMLAALQCPNTNTTEDEYELPDGLVFPLKSLEDVDLLENHLEADKHLQKHLIALWSTCGGYSVYDAVRRIFEGVVDNGLGRVINWTGQGGKRAFKTLRLRTILEKAIRKNKATCKATDVEIQREVAHFLKGASDRCGGRKERLARAAAAAADVDVDLALALQV